MNENWLPPLLTLKEFGGDPVAFLEAIYQIFRKDFIESRPIFRGQPVGHKRHPLIKNKEATFWHIISEGETEAERLPDLDRWSRIRWPRPIIEGCDAMGLRFWLEKRNGNEIRPHIALEDFSYLVVLAERKGYILFWTAFYLKRSHERENLRRRYERHQKS